MQGDIVSMGLELMLYGMGTVVLFLALLVVATTTMSRLIERHFPEPEPVASQPAPRAHATGAPGDPRLAAVISAAIHRHRAGRK